MFNFQTLSGGQKAALVLMSTLVLAGAGFLVWQLLHPQTVVIYQDNKLDNVARVTTQLALDDIDYQLTNNGTTVLVAQSQANQTRVKLAEVNADDLHSVGFELFDNVDYSMTEHAQKVTYQRALQGELERTLSGYHEVAMARVHVMIPQRKLFTLDQANARASVSLTLEPEAVLTANQIASMQGLVAASVEGLNEDNVIVLNGYGLKISSHKQQGNGYLEQPPSTHSAAHLGSSPTGQLALEQQLSDKAMVIMGLYFKPSEVAISVSVTLDHSQTKQVEQSLLAGEDNQGFVSSKKETVDYQPPSDKKAANGQNKKSEIQYRHGTRTRETTFFAGAIKRLNVAVAIVSPINEAQLDKIRKLLGAGLGIETTRGDRLSVEGFASLGDETMPETIVTPAETVVTPAETVVTPVPTPVIAPAVTPARPLIAAFNKPEVWPMPDWRLIAVFITIVLMLVVGFLWWGYRRQSMGNARQEALLLEFDDWVHSPRSAQHVR